MTEGSVLPLTYQRTLAGALNGPHEQGHERSARPRGFRDKDTE
jgi:hypothetical protein